MLVGGGHQGGAGGPERIEDDDQEKNAEQVAAGRDVAGGPVGEKPGAEGHHDENDDDGDYKGELAGAAEEGAGERVVSCTVGEGHLGFEGVVDHLDHLQRDAGDGAGGAEDDDLSGAEGVTDGEQASLQAEGVAEGKSHEGDGGAEELADFVEAGVLPAVFDPGDVAANEDAEEHGDGDVDGSEDERCHAGAHAERYARRSWRRRRRARTVFEKRAVGVAADGAIGGLQELFELSEEDGDAEVEDDPLGVGLAERGELEEAGGGKVVEAFR